MSTLPGAPDGIPPGPFGNTASARARRREPGAHFVWSPLA
ncbi:hypothetical protein MBT84_38385 [Streptomyces sp. MBT84]|nr:hypothetical protein [Streptomyces sp. MBT84]